MNDELEKNLKSIIEDTEENNETEEEKEKEKEGVFD